MRTRSSSNLPVESSPNPSTSNLKHRNRRRSKQPFILEESPVDTMADQRTMAELLREPTEGYAEAIVVPSILAEQFELKHSPINMMTSDQFFGLEKDNPHDHIHCGANSSSFEIAKLTHAVNQQTSVVTTAMTAILKQFQATLPPASVKAVEEICVTCGGAHPYYQCLAAGGNTFPELRDNIQGYVAAAIKIKRVNEANMKAMQTQINNVKNELRNEMKNSIQAFMSNQTNELKNTMASFFQMNTAFTSGSGHLPSNTIANPKGELKAITTQSGIVLDGPFVPIPLPFINPEENEQYQKMLKALLSNKEKLLELANTPLNENCSAVILEKLHEKLGDPGKFLILCGFSELKCKALADLGFSINLMPLSIGKKLGLPELISTRMTLELANWAICTSAGIGRVVFVPVGKFTFPFDFVIVDYESDPRVPLILGRTFLQTAQVKDDVFDPEGCNVLIEKFLDLDSTKYLHPPHNVNPLSGSTTSPSSLNHLLEEFADELALITFLLGNDDLPFDIEFDHKEIEYLLNNDPIKDMDSILEDSVDEDNLADLNDNLADSMPEIFTDEHALDYSSHPLYDEYDDDLFKVESDTEYVYDDPFDSKGEKIKESKLLIDDLDLLRLSNFLPSPKYDSFLFEDFSEVDALPSINDEDKVFNPGILIQENLFEVITRVAPDKNVKKIAISHASLILEDFDPPLYELPFLKVLFLEDRIYYLEIQGDCCTE
nr:reverse transcriptase domain-containing protein [Tanacetum cinerariifolium]